MASSTTRRLSVALDTNAETISVVLTFVTADAIAPDPPVITASANGISGTGYTQHEAIVSWLSKYWGVGTNP